MALFSKKTIKTPLASKNILSKKMVVTTKNSNTPKKAVLTGDSKLFPRITEKATWSAEKGVYVFNISPRVTKSEVKKMVEHFYKVRPMKVTILKVPSKKTLRKGIPGKTASGKKAYIFLKKGDNITFA